METPRAIPSPRRAAGPQGTRLFSAEELSRLAAEAAPAPAGRASATEPVLEGVSEGLEGRRFALRPGRLTVGRGGHNDVVVEEPSVSSTHAWIVNQQGHYVVMNTLSTNGTFVNGQRVHESPIRHGDRVRFGQAEFVFLTREPGRRIGGATGWLIAAAVVAVVGMAALAWWMTARA
jgi:pSer/pThr/pTyr-binding forkhead associated (FHA) protein